MAGSRTSIRRLFQPAVLRRYDWIIVIWQKNFPPQDDGDGWTSIFYWKATHLELAFPSYSSYRLGEGAETYDEAVDAAFVYCMQQRLGGKARTVPGPDFDFIEK